LSVKRAKTAASRQHQLLLTSATISSPRLNTVLKKVRAPLALSAITSATTPSSRNAGLR
jgi:hypothetical protein